MKKLYISIAVAVAGVLAVGCNDLDTEPLGSTVTSEQKAAIMANDPSRLADQVNSLQQSTHMAMRFYSNQHRDFGLASIFLGLDSRGTDLIGPDDGYNWYSADASWGDWAGNYYANLIYWRYNYAMIYTCNSIMTIIGKDTEDPTSLYTLGQCYISRAYSYYMLANMYQLTYANNPDAPCVPIYTDENMVEAGTVGCARSTVAQTWQQVIDDATKAIDCLSRAKEGGVERPDVRFADVAVAYGLRARANLFTLKWSDAAADAQQAISLTSATPYTIAEASRPGFYSFTEAHNYMWGIQNPSEAAYTQGVVNFASMMSGWMANGYGSVGCARRISKLLYADIPDTDARKNWWIDASGKPGASLPAAYASYVTENSDVFPAYTNVKFGAAANTPGSTSGATDLPIMRVEEMYLILAEAQGHQSPATGAKTLQDFVKTYRDPAYACAAATTDDVTNAVWLQRRIELWGEGFAYFDRLRFQTGIDRRGHGFPSAWVYVVAPDDPVNRYQVVQTETQANPLITPEDALEDQTWTNPQPVADI